MPRSVALFMLCILSLTCRESLGPEPNTTVVADPPWIALLVGDSATISVARRADPGQTLSDSLVTWRSSHPGRASAAGGVVRAPAQGVVTLTAHTPEGIATAIVVVTPPTLLAAGDIAHCGRTGDEQTAALIDGLPGIVLPLGDNAYEDGTRAQYNGCYHPSWGRHRDRSRPVPGNHDYQTPGAAGYYGYFGGQAGDSGVGYYSWDLAGWHLVALNTNVSMAAGSPQETWLRADLAAHPALCTLAYWHHPTFSSSTARRLSATRPLWLALRQAGAEVILAGHAHNYERFAPQTSLAEADAEGVRLFVAGTGGHSHHPFDTVAANSEVRDSTSFGVLTLALRSDGYSWRFAPVTGASFSDSGSATCH